MAEPEQIVRSYLDAMDARDLDAAEQYLAPGFKMTFPGGVTMKKLTELTNWARKRYTKVSKSFAGFDTMAATRTEVVYCYGTLSGTWCDGTEFRDVRFIDRFELRGRLITQQDVWNDLGEARLNA
ncbi:MAG: nuclear transport factor 2 family protein [Dinoroseobacter sp.]|nr:nuclear transport factor 2 family protein [Dinoroseobacter sp.]